jgi:phosphoglycolate phosphatase-like HAD superfamily hydrolase
MPDRPTVVLDVDGTLVDTNYQHAIAWHRAFRDHGAGGPALMIGDSTWDVKAAKVAGVPTLALLTGGFAEAVLDLAARPS